MQTPAMADRFWNAAYQAVRPLLRADDVVLAPVGAWPRDVGTWQLYKGVIVLDGVSVLLLHKGQLAAIRRPDLAQVWGEWQCVFASWVFVCFVKDRRLRLDRRRTPQRLFTRALENYLQSRRLKRQPGTVFFLHNPKTAGTSIWRALSFRVRSRLYYDCGEAYLFNPPAPGEFDLVGGHIALHLLLGHLQPGDHLVGLLRKPTDRFRSAFLHSRRPVADPATFSPVMRAMREMQLGDFLQTMDAQMELRLQLLMLGFGFDRPYSTTLDATILQAAIAVASRPDAIFYPNERLGAFVRRVCALLGIGPVPLLRFNVANQQRHRQDLEEFERTKPLIEAANQPERALYTFIAERAG